MEIPSNPKKRTLFEAVAAETNKDNDTPTEQEVAAMSRSERKRHREKKRRSDVNKGFDELMSLLLEIDPEVRADAEERTSKGQCKRALGAHEDNVLSRVDLIATAIRVLRRVHGENEKHKKMIEDLILKNGGSAADLPRSAAAGAGAAGALAELGGPLGASGSVLDRAALLQKSALGATTAAASTPAAQLRAKANLLSNLPSAAGVASSLRDYSTADLLALRAAAANRAAAAQALPPPPAVPDTAAMLAARRQLLQTMMQQDSQSNLAMHTSIFGSALNASADPPASTAPPAQLMGAEALYGALGGGAQITKKQEELQRLRAAGYQS